jgi:hypothetical protein
VFFLTGPTQFQYQEENCQSWPFLVTGFSETAVLIGNFLFGTEIGEGKLEKKTSYLISLFLYYVEYAADESCLFVLVRQGRHGSFLHES